VPNEIKERVLSRKELISTNKLREFQRKLYRKAKAEKKFRFYSLYDKTYRMDILEEAYRKVKSNGGTCGVDGKTCGDIESEGLTEYLAELQNEMKQRYYQPQPVRRVYIPKANGKERPLGIPTIRDRIVQTAFKLVLEPIFEADFSSSSFGFRRKKGAHDAITEIYKYLNWGCTEVYDVDIAQYFDTVDHRKLIKMISRRISDGQILHVIRQWLKCGYVEDGKRRKSECGTPQGGVISPLLANIYLNPIDQVFERRGLGAKCKGSIHIVRYADDMIILAQRNLEDGVVLLRHYLERLGLRLNQEKTHKLNLKLGKSVDFLGFRFLHTQNRKNRKRLMLVYPSPQSQQRCKDKVRKLLHHSIPIRTKDQIENLNKFLRGWVSYYRLGNAGSTFHDIANFTEKRVRRQIQRRKGKGGYGWNRLNRKRIYDELGLFNDYSVLRFP